MNLPIILASTSVFRKQLLEKLNIQFETVAPEINETPLDSEKPQQLVERLSLLKAREIADRFSQHLIIGSDQVACLNQNEILGKPGNFNNAFEQLSAASGKKVIFYTGLTLLNSQTGKAQTCCECYSVTFRSLDDNQISRYLKKEQPYNCAGSFKSEGYGITLFEKLEGDDPNTLIGLPLIRLVGFLDSEGVCVP